MPYIDSYATQNGTSCGHKIKVMCLCTYFLGDTLLRFRRTAFFVWISIGTNKDAFSSNCRQLGSFRIPGAFGISAYNIYVIALLCWVFYFMSFFFFFQQKVGKCFPTYGICVFAARYALCEEKNKTLRKRFSMDK